MTLYCQYCGAKLENGEAFTECPECLIPLGKETKCKIPYGGLIKQISTDESFMNAMEDLYEKDPIEFRLKIQQFKNQLAQQKQVVEESNVPKCPTCQSTNLSKISTTKKVAKIAAFGIFGMGDNGKTWKCNNCGSKF
ncbi:hypothetical protein DS742_26215 [Lacrimispora amygdalina]|uniref:Uncharacterized protein n=1 Tax=Lacrimispora amygdalina TaxID=253257 RepID=A0A3E2N4L0_9FIRM|nr:hypothetical protein [Clostridium indicum]RFZ75937.1 hypothetical protein DS742_26215 [Clostridium indicum]